MVIIGRWVPFDGDPNFGPFLGLLPPDSVRFRLSPRGQGGAHDKCVTRRGATRARARRAKPAPRPPFYVFPELETLYRLNPDRLTDRVPHVMKTAGFFNPKDDEALGPLRREGIGFAR